MSTGLDIAPPENWSWSPLKFATIFLNRGTAPDYADNGTVRAIGQAANQPGGLDWERARFHNYDGNPKQLKGYLVRNDVLINSTGTGTLGRVGYFTADPDGFPCIADGHVTIARSDRRVVEPRFLFYWLSSTPFQDYVYSALIVGATNQIELNRERLAGAPIVLPPISEQRRIADFLDAETARIDALTRNRHAQVILAKERHNALLVRRVSGLTDAMSTVLRQESADGIISLSAPADWSSAPVRRIMRKCSRKVSSTDSVITAYRDGQVTLRSNRRDDGYTFSDMETGYQGVEPGDLVFHALDGFAGAVGVSDSRGKASPVYHVCRMIGSDDPRFMAFALRAMGINGYLEVQAGNVRQRSVDFRTWEAFARLPLPRPPVSQQAAISDEIEESLRWSSSTIELCTKQLDLMAERRQALITAAVTGQIDVTTARGIESSGGAA